MRSLQCRISGQTFFCKISFFPTIIIIISSSLSRALSSNQRVSIQAVRRCFSTTISRRSVRRSTVDFCIGHSPATRLHIAEYGVAREESATCYFCTSAVLLYKGRTKCFGVPGAPVQTAALRRLPRRHGRCCSVEWRLGVERLRRGDRWYSSGAPGAPPPPPAQPVCCAMVLLLLFVDERLTARDGSSSSRSNSTHPRVVELLRHELNTVGRARRQNNNRPSCEFVFTEKARNEKEKIRTTIDVNLEREKLERGKTSVSK